jgi:hypothetical protein
LVAAQEPTSNPSVRLGAAFTTPAAPRSPTQDLPILFRTVHNKARTSEVPRSGSSQPLRELDLYMAGFGGVQTTHAPPHPGTVTRLAPRAQTVRRLCFELDHWVVLEGGSLDSKVGGACTPCTAKGGGTDTPLKCTMTQQALCRVDRAIYCYTAIGKGIDLDAAAPISIGDLIALLRRRQVEGFLSAIMVTRPTVFVKIWAVVAKVGERSPSVLTGMSLWIQMFPRIVNGGFTERKQIRWG